MHICTVRCKVTQRLRILWCMSNNCMMDMSSSSACLAASQHQLLLASPVMQKNVIPGLQSDTLQQSPTHEDELILIKSEALNKNVKLYPSPQQESHAATCHFYAFLNLPALALTYITRLALLVQQQAGAQGVRDDTAAEAHDSVQQSASGAERTAARSNQQPRTGPWHTTGQHNKYSSCACSGLWRRYMLV